jgi:ubiquinone/menaquinone biosynthesis C-methylase UbiE
MNGQAVAFYDKFAGKYDSMISDKRYTREMPFFNTIFRKHNVRSILDCSCGTGRHAVMFSSRGLDVTGSDVSAEMLKEARRNAALAGAKVRFVRADFKRLGGAFDERFDCVVSLGNSLNHELAEKGMLSALRSMYGVLRRNGVVVVQIRNLSMSVKEKKRIFPIHFHKEPNGDRKLFIYVLDFHKTKVTFNVVSFLEFKGKPSFDVNSVDYRIVSAERLGSLMRAAGFKGLKAYGDFEFTRFNKERNGDLIVIGTK